MNIIEKYIIILYWHVQKQKILYIIKNSNIIYIIKDEN